MSKDVHDEATSQQRARNAGAAQMYLDCASRARAHQRDADTTPGPVRAWERLTGSESQETATRRREAARQEAVCAERASAIWSSRAHPPKESSSSTTIGSCPDAATKNAHRSARYNRLISRLDNHSGASDKIDPALVNRYPWCVDKYLNAEEEALTEHASLDGRLWRLFTGTDEPVVSGIKAWTDFDVSACLVDHSWRDHLSGVHPMGAHAPSS